jgi:hypothetical protein
MLLMSGNGGWQERGELECGSDTAARASEEWEGD